MKQETVSTYLGSNENPNHDPAANEDPFHDDKGKFTTGDGTSTKLPPQAVAHYGNFALNALAGRNPDQYYEEHQSDIDAVADKLRLKYGPKEGTTIYRGIILDPSEVHNGVVKSVPEIKYASFSDDKDVALAFGDPKNPMSEPLMSRYPNKRGYLITQTYDPKQLLYHHSWSDALNVRAAFGDDANFTNLQKEVMLKPQPEYHVVPIEAGISHGKIVGNEVEALLMANGFNEEENRDAKGKWTSNIMDGGYGANGRYNRAQRNLLNEMKAKQADAEKTGKVPPGCRYDYNNHTTPLPPDSVRNHLLMLSQVVRAPGQTKLKYYGMADFTAHEGEEFKVPGSPPPIKLQTPKECYRNCANTALSHPDKYSYCEGYVRDSGLPFPIEHAWLQDNATKMVVDPTLGWRPHTQYFGVKFDDAFLRKKLLQNGHYGLASNGDIPNDLVLGADKDYKYAH